MREPFAKPLAPPSGMTELLPPDAASRASLRRRISTHFERHGYEAVVTAPFEHAAVIERGLAASQRQNMLRFVEPETGEVALLRPDITPQIARLIATQLHDRPPPIRLHYAGSLFRQRTGRARRRRQLFQLGVECVGVPGLEADLEVITLGASALSDVGLPHLRIELSLVSIAREALSQLPPRLRAPATEALMRKDRSDMSDLLSAPDVPPRARKSLVASCDLFGEPAPVLEAARSHFTRDPEKSAIRQLEALVEGLGSRGFASQLIVDLGEVRNFSYYTGVAFDFLAAGPGESVGNGGRYDRLLEQYNAPAPATGFSIDLGNLFWALERAGASTMPYTRPRVALAGAVELARDQAAGRLRAHGVDVAVLYGGGRDACRHYAEAWQLDAAVHVDGEAWVFHRRLDGQTRTLSASLSDDEAASLTRWLKSTETHSARG